MSTLDNHWSNSHRLLLYATFIFVVLFAVTTSEVLEWLPYIRPYTNPVFETLVLWSAKYIFQIQEPFIYQISSDSLGLLIHLFNLMVISLAVGLSLFAFPKLSAKKIYYWLHTFVSYYIALQLLIYGFNKVFKYQFFLPEPNTLYATVGETPRDLLFWSLMGSAYGYTVFGGILEVIAGLLLLFQKTRLLGGLLSIGLFVHVVAINFGFNISVKVYSSCYLLFAILIIVPHFRRLYGFFILNKWISIKNWRPNYTTKSSRLLYALTKTLVVGLLFLECLYPYFESNNFNDDSLARPTFHGAYQVSSFVQNTISYPAMAGYTQRWKNVFIHRRGYWIIEYMDGRRQDYEFRWDATAQLFELTHTQTKERTLLQYQQLEDNTLELSGKFAKNHLKTYLQPLDWRALPLLQYEFHWTIDELRE